MRLLLFSPLLLLMVFAACSDREKIPVEKVEATDNYGNQEIYFRRESNYAKEGFFTRLTPLGEKMEEAFFQNDTLHGRRVLFYENEDTQSVETYDMGLFAGPYRLYYPSGQLQQEGQYQNNEMTGPWKLYYENGQLKEVVHFSENQENGPFVEYYENGAIKAEGQYRNGAFEHGELKLYDESGELTRIMDCEQGVCRTRWQAEDGE